MEIEKKETILTNEYVFNLLLCFVRSCNNEVSSHMNNVSRYSEILLAEYNNQHPGEELPEKYMIAIPKAARIHDIGKIFLPKNILDKEGRLDPGELNIARQHTERGFLILKRTFVCDDWFSNVCIETAKSHHERWKGDGYPEHMKGEEIPFYVQITSVADVYDALTTKRPYKDAYSHEIACKMIENGECGQFSETMIKLLKGSNTQLELLTKGRLGEI